MARRILLVPILGLFVSVSVTGQWAQAQTAGAQRRALGTYGLWGAFREPGRCFAIAEASASSMRGTRPFASIGYWPGRGGGQVHLRLSRPMRADSAVLLRIGERTFALSGREWDAWTSGPAADAEVIAAMRTGLTMVVETRSANGALIRDQYRLQGAPSAIDAAALGCARG